MPGVVAHLPIFIHKVRMCDFLAPGSADLRSEKPIKRFWAMCATLLRLSDPSSWFCCSFLRQSLVFYP